MKVPKLNLIRACFFAVSLFAFSACSAFERAPEAADEPPFPPSEAGETTAAAAADDTVPPASENYMENEIARLNTKVEALETKLAAMDGRASEDNVRGAQPKLRAEASPEEDMQIAQDHDPEASQGASVASRLATKLPLTTKSAADASALNAGEDADAAPAISGNVEKDFQSSMQVFENGNFKEAANRFFAISKEYKNHPLASHALYWAGESALRARNWKIAIAHFSNLEDNYPRSVYIADALAGLSNAYSASANSSEAKRYRDVVVSAFPDSSAAMGLGSKLSAAQQEGE